MTKFGFNILNRNVVSLNGQDNTKWQQLIDSQQPLMACISCGACTAVCPRAISEGVSVRKAILRTRRGQDIGVDASACLMCNKCALVCPRNLNTRLVWFELEQLEEKKSIHG